MEGSRKSKDVESLEISRTVNGGFIVKHRFDNSMNGPSYMSPKDYAFTDEETLIAHIKKTLGGKKG